MKLAAILSAIVLLTTLSCTRNCGPEEGSTTLQGKWKYIQLLIDPGDGSGTWQPKPAGETFIEFRADGTLATDINSFSSFNRYEIKSDSTVVLTGAPGTTSFSTRYSITGNTMELKPQCFERCGLKFTRQ